MAVEKYTRFKRAVVDWLITSTDLVTLTGHTANAPRIFGVTGEDKNRSPQCGVRVQTLMPLMMDIDNGLYDSMISCLLRHSDSAKLLNMMGEIEELASQDSATYQDASFTDSGDTLATNHIRFLGPTRDAPVGSAVGDGMQGEFQLVVQVKIIWAEK